MVPEASPPHTFPADATAAISARINAERIVLLGWSRAILLQLAHPLIAAGVAEHSSFREGRLTAAVRLHETVRAMLSLTFGTDAERSATLARINEIHRRVNGTLREDAGTFRAGARYSAEDPALLIWVHATLLESVPLAYEAIVAPLTRQERDAYCREAAPIAHALGATTGVPESWADVRDYMGRMYASGDIAVSTDARLLASAVLAPPFAWLVAPMAYVNRLFTVGWLPQSLRTQYGFSWSARDQRSLERWSRTLRGVRRMLPASAALWPEARHRRLRM
jgi:uncharacterized protein (DUF2236 family)